MGSEHKHHQLLDIVECVKIFWIEEVFLVYVQQCRLVTMTRHSERTQTLPDEHRYTTTTWCLNSQATICSVCRRLSCTTRGLTETGFVSQTSNDSQSLHWTTIILSLGDHVVPAKRAGYVPVLQPFLEAGCVENMAARQVVYLCIWCEFCQANRTFLLWVVGDAHCIKPDGWSSGAKLLYVGLRGSSPTIVCIQGAFNGILFPRCNPDANDAKDWPDNLLDNRDGYGSIDQNHTQNSSISRCRIRWETHYRLATCLKT